MFQSARLKLTAWYLLIIMLVSGFFSAAFYHSSSREIQRIINRIEFEQQLAESGNITVVRRPKNMSSIEELQSIKARSLVALLIINGVIFIFAGTGGYFLAGQTLKPIRLMVDEQNQFISNASHQLRTPIATLRAEMEGSLLEKHISDAQARKLITSNLEELNTLQELSNHLLQLAQPHTMGNQIKLTNISVLKTITAALKKTRTLAKQKNIKIETELKDAVVKAQFSPLTELFTIILDNAIKYSPAKTTISITTKKTSRKITLRIKDQGVGIAAADLPHIFKRFYRADKSRSQADGYGLGLSIAKKTLELCGGSIEVKSKVNSGTTFIITLPLSEIS